MPQLIGFSSQAAFHDHSLPASIIASHFPELPRNVRVVEPHEKINSWSVIHAVDVGLVHTSTIGMELPLEGVPCVVVSRTHYRNKRFTVDIATRDEYFCFLETFSALAMQNARMVTLAKRYAFLLFERYQIPFPYLYESGCADPRALAFCSSTELLAQDSMALIVDTIEPGTPFLLPNDGSEFVDAS